MSAGVLGTKPREVEENLHHALELCKIWNAMLLLDEADVFLGSRTDDSVARNELVSSKETGHHCGKYRVLIGNNAVFLTNLEYYQGLLFLTTNRISSIDYAFQSRVDLFLPYSDLTTQARKQVWENFINHAGRDRFETNEDELQRLSLLDLNGREIKNVVKSAELLSLRSGGKTAAEMLYTLAQNRIKALQLLANKKEPT